MKTLFTCILSLALGIGLTGQNLDETYALGTEQFRLRNYETSSLAFERVLFFGEGKYLAPSLEHLGKIEQLQGRFESAALYYSRAAKASEEYNERSRMVLSQSYCLLSLGKFKLALIELYGLSDNIPDSFLYYRNFLVGVAHFSENNFKESHDAFSAAFPDSAASTKQKLDSLFTRLEKIKHPNPRTAKILSIIIPGAGQFYAGDIKNGFNSLLLTGAFFALGLHTALNFSLFDALASVAPWVQRYYMGGFKRAEIIAANRLREKQDAVYQQVLNLYSIDN